MPRIFLSYRPDDAPGHAGRIHDRLVERFGSEEVFVDAAELRSGVDLIEGIERAMDAADVLVVVIGPGWLAPSPPAGGASGRTALHRRLTDMVIRAAMEEGIAVRPVLVGGAEMPDAGSLPVEIARLARTPALDVSDLRFDADVARLIGSLEGILREGGRERSSVIGGANEGTRRTWIAEDGSGAGQPLELRGEGRKIVTVLFSDLVASTELGEALDPEALNRVLDRYFAEMHRVIALHGGIVEKYIGDAVMAVFGLPTLHEDDAVRAVRAAWGMRDALAEVNAWLAGRWGIELQARTGINTGVVLVGVGADQLRLIVGDAVNTAARLEQAADPGQILVGERTYRLVRRQADLESLEPLTVKGKARSVQAWRLVGWRDEPAGDGEPLLPLVDRREQLNLLHRAFERAVEDRSCHLFTLIGQAGVGKSRLLAEFSAAMGDRARVLRGRCLTYGEGVTLWPIAELVRSAGGIEPADPPAVARERVRSLLTGCREADVIEPTVVQAIGLEPVSASPEEVFWAVRRLFEHIAQDRPLVIVVEDIHWAEPTLLDLLEHVADWSRGAPILMICAARHELLELRPGWGGGKLNATSTTLEPLGDADSETIVANLLGGGELDPPLRRWMFAVTEGNPLFIEEIVRLLTEDGTLRRDDGRWVAAHELADLSVPPTISALLAARIDRLPEEAREVLKRAAIIGREFQLGAVEDLSPPTLRPQVRQELMALIRKELIRPAPSDATDESFRFRHILIRDAAYEAMPKETRGSLHERFADWLEAHAGDRIGEVEEMVGHHLDQAYTNLTAVAPPGDHERDLAARAADRLAAAGSRAANRGDMRAALKLLPRAVALEPPDAPHHVEHLVSLTEALWESGDFARAASALDAVQAAASSADDELLVAHARIIALWGELFAAPDGDTQGVRGEAERLIRMFQEVGDDGGLARAWTIIGELNLDEGRAEAAGAAAARAADHALRDGHARLTAGNLSLFAAAGAIGPTPVPDAIDRCNDVLERLAGDPVAEAWVGRHLARLLAMRGDFDEGRALVRRGKEVMEQFGYGFILAGGLSQNAAYLERLAGHPAAAEAELRWGYRILTDMGERSLLASLAAQLAMAIHAQGPGRIDEAEELTHVSERSAGAGQLGSQIEWRTARSRIEATRGRTDRALELIRQAASIADRTDFLNEQADARADLAEVYRAAGLRSEARAAFGDALARYESKGNVIAAAAVRSSLDGLDEPA